MMPLGTAARARLDEIAEALVEDWRVFSIDAVSQAEVAGSVAEMAAGAASRAGLRRCPMPMSPRGAPRRVFDIVALGGSRPSPRFRRPSCSSSCARRARGSEHEPGVGRSRCRRVRVPRLRRSRRPRSPLTSTVLAETSCAPERPLTPCRISARPVYRGFGLTLWPVT